MGKAVPTRGDRRRAERAAREREARARAATAARRRRLVEIGAAVAVAVVVAVVLIALNRPGSADLGPIAARAGQHPGVPANGRVLGDPNAPVQVVEYGDYQCPGCGQFARSDEARLVEEYVATGKIGFQYRDFAFLGERGGEPPDDESTQAAEAAACAADQGRFWDYHATLFANQEGENGGAFGDERLKAMADALGLDRAAFDACLDGGVKQAEVLAMTQEARDTPIEVTPSFVVNGQVVEYAGYDDLKAAIDAALAGGQ